MSNIQAISGEKAEALLRDIATIMVNQCSHLPYIQPDLNAQQLITISGNYAYALTEIARLFEKATKISDEEGEQ